MHAQRYEITVPVSAGGVADVTSPVVNGRILSIQYVKTDYADGSTFTLTGKRTGMAIWSESNVNASTTRAPGQPTHSQVGAAIVQGDSASPVNDYIYVADEEIRIQVSGGGVSKTGKFYITVG